MCSDWFSSGSSKGLESEFLEKPFVLARLVALLESGLDVGLALALASGILKFFVIRVFRKLE